MLPDSYLTLDATATAELKEQRSRFIGLAAPAANADAARAFIQDCARRYHDARHVCHGWKLGLGTDAVENRNDDGEPSGTAGEPILAAIRRTPLTDVVVVVVRYFGGIKLGCGGLSRAYGGTADLVLEQAPRREVLLGRQFDLQFPYPQRKTVEHFLTLHRGKPVHEEYGAEVSWRMWLPHSTAEDFLKTL
ncbi:hypothetical protein CSB20_06385, partial [bacterium DOLZORAL124_64_63]